jgi:predicted DNA-binding transcriptional regulator YafY
MTDKAPREAGFSKDADKLIRRLSLVAFLLTHHGRPVRAEDVRGQVEGYALMTDEAFKRRFYEDRSALAGLGIEIRSETDTEGGGELYSLPAANYYLPPIEFTREELAALGSCLAVLQERFAYSKPLRLALLSLAQGRPELLEEAAAPPLAVLPQKEALRAAARLPKLQAAVADRKSVLFSYYAINRDEELERRVDPYGLLMVGDEWYLLGYCHLRRALRTFRLSRIRSRIRYATKAPHDFPPPSGFSLAAYRDRPPWQLDGRQRQAVVRVGAGMAWWVQAHFGHCGSVDLQDDGSIVYTTGYGGARQLVAWALGLGDEAEILAPDELRAEAVAQLARLRDRLLSPPHPRPAVARERPAAVPRADDWHVDVDRFTRLTALTTYLLQHCREGRACVPVAQVCRALDMSRDELKADVRVLNLVNFGGDGALLWAEFEHGELEVTCDLAGPALAEPPRLSPLQADTLLLALEVVGGHLPAGSPEAARSAEEKIRRARQGRPPRVAAEEAPGTRSDLLGVISDAVCEHRLLSIDYWSEGSDRTSSRIVEPYLLIRSRGEWYYVCYCRTSAATRVFRVATTRRLDPLEERFAPREDVELELYRREGIPTSSQYASRSAEIWYSPLVRRWVEERQAVEPCADGACVSRQPYVDGPWLAHYVLRFGGEAVPLSPPEAGRSLLALVERLLSRYEAHA